MYINFNFWSFPLWLDPRAKLPPLVLSHTLYKYLLVWVLLGCTDSTILSGYGPFGFWVLTIVNIYKHHFPPTHFSSNQTKEIYIYFLLFQFSILNTKHMMENKIFSIVPLFYSTIFFNKKKVMLMRPNSSR